MCTGTILLGAGVVRGMLCRASASGQLLKITYNGISTWASVGGEISAVGGYVANGKQVAPPTARWTVGVSTKAMKWTYTTIGIVFTANGASLNNIKYFVLRNSTGAGNGRVVCYVTLSTAPFTINTGNTLTILPPAAGVFSLA